jgi:hypothetical protein
MEIQGRIKFIGQTQTFGQNGFQKREVVIVTEEQYPQSIIFDFTQDNCYILDNFQVNQLVKISFNIRGREWTNPQGETKYFNTLQGWRIEGIQYTQPSQPQQQQQFTQNQYQQPAPVPQPTVAAHFEPYNGTANDMEDDGLPF